MHPRPRPSCHRGLTLVEVLAAIAVMTVLSLLAWRGLDAMQRTQEGVQARGQAVQALQGALQQWGIDLDEAIATGTVPAVQWDGLSLRLTRRGGAGDRAGVRVIAWSLRGVGADSRWLRWEAPPVTDQGALIQAWERANQWARNASAAEQRLEIDMGTLSQWQVFFYRGDAWTHPMSGSGSSGADSAVPDGVRLVLQAGPPLVPNTPLTRDWVNPVIGGGKS